MIDLLERTVDRTMVGLEKISPSLFSLATRYKIYVKYIFSGGTAVAADLILLALFKEVFVMNYLVAAILAFIIAFGVSFTMQKFWTFSDKKINGMHRQVVIYFVIAVGNLLVNTLLMYVFVDFIHVWYLLSQVIASGLIALTSFFLYRRLVFKVVSSN